MDEVRDLAELDALAHKAEAELPMSPGMLPAAAALKAAPSSKARPKSAIKKKFVGDDE